MISTSKFVYTFLAVFLVHVESAKVDQCITPNDENAFCVPLDNCPILYNGLKTLNDAVIDFTKKSVCKTEGNVHYVCCGTFSCLKTHACVTPNQEQGECVKLDSCPIILDGVRALNQTVIDFARKSICRTERDVQYVCCGTLSYLLLPAERIADDTLNAPTILMTATATASISIKKESENPLVSNRKYCGYQHTDGRFYNEDDTAIDEFPWVALLIHENDTVKDQQHCLGTLINNRYVVATAICVNNTDANAGFKITSVRLGEYNTNATLDCVSYSDYEECSEPVIKVAVEETILHPDYKLDIKGISFNIALIRLANKISYSDFVRPICLPNLKFRAQVGDNLTTTGWGTTVWEPDVNKKSKIKKRENGIVSPLQECIQKAEINLEGAVSETYHICFSEGADGSCADDSSAPLMSKYKNQWQLEGILSFPTAQKCGKGALNIYTNVSSHLQWIIDTVRP